MKKFPNEFESEADTLRTKIHTTYWKMEPNGYGSSISANKFVQMNFTSCKDEDTRLEGNQLDIVTESPNAVVNWIYTISDKRILLEYIRSKKNPNPQQGEEQWVNNWSSGGLYSKIPDRHWRLEFENYRQPDPRNPRHLVGVAVLELLPSILTVEDILQAQNDLTFLRDFNH